MMSSSSETEDHFFDTKDEVSSVSDLSCDGSVDYLSSTLENTVLGYEFWTKKPDSVNERRDKFLKWMGLNSHLQEDACCEVTESGIDRSKDNVEAMSDNVDFEPEFFSNQYLQSLQSCETKNSVEDRESDEKLLWKIKNLDNGMNFVMEDLADDGTCYALHEAGSDKMISLDEFQKTIGSSALVRQLLRKDSKKFDRVDSKKDSKKKVKSTWLSSINQVADKAKALLDMPNETHSKDGTSTGEIRVHVSKKHSKELSSLHTVQEFPAHEGSILTMKFSHDGQYLASAGVDGVVRVWNVLEEEVLNKSNGQDFNPLSLSFSQNHYSKSDPHNVNEKISQIKKLKKSPDSASVILPPKVFKLSEKPLHEFYGHSGEILALSWSKNGKLLSSSVDYSVRLWKIGHDHCLGIYSHNNYVTCVEFNPVDDNHFISGSIDGKLRIWEVEGGRVIDWIDIREILTAVCYSPDGRGGVVGSMEGNCRFYEVVDNRLELGAQVCLKGKKLPGKKITGFQYCPNDASKIMVTSADSQVRILCGTNIVCKFKGNRSSVSHAPASFTSDGEHILSATEDSNVQLWNYTSHDQKSSSHSKTIKSRERFSSLNASIAIPWGGLKNKIGALPGNILKKGHFDEKLLQKLSASFPDRFATSLGFFLDALHKSSATWPEEKLPKRKAEFKFLKNAWLNALNAPHLWGLVVVTAGWDGCIRTFLNYGLPIRF